MCKFALKNGNFTYLIVNSLVNGQIVAKNPPSTSEISLLDSNLA